MHLAPYNIRTFPTQSAELSSWQRRVAELNNKVSELEDRLTKGEKELAKKQEECAKLQRDLRENVAQKEDQVREWEEDFGLIGQSSRWRW